MSAGPHRIRQREVARGIRAFQQATKVENENVLVDFHQDGSYSISARAPSTPGPKKQSTEEWKLPDELPAEVRP